VAGAAAADCPTALGAGVRLSTGDGALVLELRPAGPGLIAERRQDDRPDTPEGIRRAERTVALGMIGLEVRGANWARVTFGRDLGALGLLGKTLLWESPLTVEVGALGGPATAVSTGRQSVSYLGTVTRRLGGCSYAAWHLEHRRELAIPGRDPALQTFQQWWAPALGVAIGLTDPVPQGLGPDIPFARIEALD
jgi:hypothetical protein